MSEKTSVSFEQVSKVATNMLTQGVTPSVRGVMAVTGGKTETVSKYLRDFHEKRNAEVLRMADELGSSAIAKLLATEVQNVVDRKTERLQKLIAELKAQRDELVEILSEQEKDCQHRVDMAEAKATQAINDVNEKITQAKERTEQAEIKATEYSAKAEQAKVSADEIIKAAEGKCELLVSNAKSEAASLVDAASKRADKAEQETAALREQVKSLSIKQAKREIEQEQYRQVQELHSTTVAALADERTTNATLQARQEGQVADIQRLTNELAEMRADSKQLASIQGQLIELQKQYAQAQSALVQSERERESLSLALRRQD